MCLREKLEAWLAKRGKTPSSYRHMMCFGFHGHGHGNTDGHGDGHIGRSSNAVVGRMQRESGKQDMQRDGDNDDDDDDDDDDVARSLFTVAE